MQYPSRRNFQISCSAVNHCLNTPYETFLPDTYSDRPPLHVAWELQERQLAAKKQNNDLKCQLKVQEKMMQEATVFANMKHGYERKHIRLLGKTEDISRGCLSDILQPVIELTSERE